MIKNLVIFVICILVIYLDMKVFSKLESRLNESYGWKTDLLFCSSAIITIIAACVATYSIFQFFVKCFSLLRH